MAFTKAIRKQRIRMWNEDPRCYWCGALTVLVEKNGGPPVLPNEATIDHIRPRHHPGRQEPPTEGERRRVLSCWKCNNETLSTFR